VADKKQGVEDVALATSANLALAGAVASAAAGNIEVAVVLLAIGVVCHMLKWLNRQ